ncbi:MAG TPA: T9SS type A sorting domain-containing protein [Flavipsychrobacter sp.]|nr:T9SS type A sorting domain-containing protein [Flavipsychrobacter sp.]
MKKIFLFYILSIVFTTSAFAQGYTGLIARWPFNGNANDVSGNGLNGIIHGATPAKGYNGLDSTAYRFNGNGDFIYVPNNDLMSVSGNISICALIKPEGFYSGECQGNVILWRGSQESTGNFYELEYYDNAYDRSCDSFSPNHEVFAMAVGYPTASLPDSVNYYPSAIDTGKWYCVVATHNNDSEKIYVDGALKLAIYKPSLTDSLEDAIVIGMCGAFTDTIDYPYHLNAVVDEIRLYNRALSQSEVQTFCDSAKRLPNDSSNTSVNTIMSPERIIITPNPVTSIITVTMPHDWSGAIVQVVNSVGQQIIKRTLDGNTNNTIDLSLLPPGMYLLRVQYNNAVLTKKLIKN